MNAIVVVLDRMSSGLVGPYGNTWIDTPAWNQLACRSLLLETTLADSPCLDLAYRAFWFGLHAACVTNPCHMSLAGQLHERGIHTALVTDAPPVAALPGAAEFAERIELDLPPTRVRADDVPQTQFAQLLAAATHWLSRAEPPYSLWIHARALAGPWDAPAEYCERFADEDDPLPPTIVTPPARSLPRDFDPDELLGISHACAGQVVAQDQCLGGLLEALETARGSDETLLAVVAARGFPLGEHRRIGDADPALYGELCHVPFLLQLPNGSAAMLRSHTLVQSPDLYATLADWFHLGPLPATAWGRSLLSIANDQFPALDRVLSTLNGQRSLRTPGWLLHSRPDRAPELFAKPDDRWEVNDVARRCPDIVAELQPLVADFERAVQLGRREQLTPLPELLLYPRA